MERSNARSRSRSQPSSHSYGDESDPTAAPSILAPRGHRAGRHRDTWARRAKMAKQAAENGAMQAEQALLRSEALAEKAHNAEMAARQAQDQRSNQRSPHASQPGTPTRPPLGARKRSPPPLPPPPPPDWTHKDEAHKGKGSSKGKGKGKGPKAKSPKKQAHEEDQSWGKWQSEADPEHRAATTRIGRAAPIECTFHETISRDLLQLLRYGATRTHLGVFRKDSKYDVDAQGARFRTVHLQKLDYSNDGYCLATTLAALLAIPLKDLETVARTSKQPKGGKLYFRTKEGVEDLLVAPANIKGHVSGAVRFGE